MDSSSIRLNFVLLINHKKRKMKNLFQTTALLLLSTMSITAQHNKVLFVLSAADTLELNNGQKLRQTGVFLNEFYIAYKAVVDAGYTIEFATPNGVRATIDEESIKDDYWKKHKDLKHQAIQFVEEDDSYQHPKTLEEALANRKNYAGLIIPGGQGLMVDLINDRNTPLLLKYFAAANKPTGLICHAPSLLLTIPKEDNPYVGFTVNSVSLIEEFYIETFVMKGKPKKRKISKELKKLGLKYKCKFPKANFAVKDRNLITSQNPFSGSSFTKLYLEALAESI